MPTTGVVDHQRLVALKKTQRERDYPIIGVLVEQALREWLARGPLSGKQVGWVLAEARTYEALSRLSDAVDIQGPLNGCPRPCLRPVEQALRQRRYPSDAERDAFQAELDAERRALQEADRRYWRSIIADLKTLRRQGALLGEGTSVVDHLDHPAR